jgi:hypothetical protein
MDDIPDRGETQSTDEIEDRRLITELLQNWVVWRDAGDWERFRAVWHPDGRMMATWTQGTGDDFIAVSKEGWARGVSILHFLGGTSIDLAGDRAISQTKMTISQRATVEQVEVDVLCTGRLARSRGSTGPCSKRFRLATATSPICRPGSAAPLRRTCLG